MRQELQQVASSDELKKSDKNEYGDKNARAVTRTINKINTLVNNLPKSERISQQLLMHLRSAIKGIEFTKQEQSNSFQYTKATFENLWSAVMNASRVEDINCKRHPTHPTYLVNVNDDEQDGESDLELFDLYLVEKRYKTGNKANRDVRITRTTTRKVAKAET